MRLLRPTLALLLLTSGAACFRNPNTDMKLQQQLVDLGDVVNEVRQEVGTLQVTVDSLRLVVARQDSALTKVAMATNIPYPR